MPDPRTAVAVTWHDAKQAALYYDRVLPCADYDEIPSGIRVDYSQLQSVYRQHASEYEPSDGVSEWDDFVRSIHLPSASYDAETGWVANDYVFNACASLAWLNNDCVGVFEEDPPYEGYERLFYPEYYEDRAQWFENRFENREKYVKKTGHPMQKPGINDTPPPGMPPLRFSPAVELHLIGMKVVDTSRATWEQVLEFRTDRKSQSMLRDMRMLFDSDLRDKSPAYIADYIDSKLEKYEAACSKHGFETVTESLQLLLDSKSVLGMAVLAAASVFTGHLDIAMGSMAGGVAIETSKLALNIISRRRDFVWWSREADLSYIFEARKSLDR
jgi:hypothetical protein